jgi:PadR family transcriptional regulator PadR
MALMGDPNGRHWGYDLSKQCQLRSGALYPLLHRWLDEGWLEDGWEEQQQPRGKRPPRRYYRLTPEGIEELGGVLEQARRDVRFSSLIPKLA